LALAASHAAHGLPRGAVQTLRRALASKLAGIGSWYAHQA
jgi:hypothetical protein